MTGTRKRSSSAVRKTKVTNEASTSKRSKVAMNRTTSGLPKDDENYASSVANEVGDESSISGMSGGSSVIVASPSSKSKDASSNQTNRTRTDATEAIKQAHLQIELDKLKTQLQKQARMFKLQKASQDEDELVTIKLRRFVKERLWKKVKFITDDTVLQKAMNTCAKHFGVEDKEKPDWKVRHAKEVQFSINNRRNNCAQDLERAYMGKCKRWFHAVSNVVILLTNVVPNTGLMQDENVPDFLKVEAAFSNVRGNDRNNEDSIIRSWYFFSALVPSIAGKKIWKSDVMMSKKITDSGCVTCLDEAFTILCIENYWNKWVNKGVTAWTKSRSGNTGFMGWDKRAYTHFVELCRRIKRQRDESASDDLEHWFQEKASAEFGSGRGSSRRRFGETDVETYDELDD
jgi:hypothetical protein